MSQDLGPYCFDSPPILFGATTSIRRAVAERLGGWVERFRTAYEDVDLTKRLREKRIPIRYEAGCVAYHLRRDTLGSVLDAFWRWHFPESELLGHFDSLERWVADRLDLVFERALRHMLDVDVAHGHAGFLPLTLLLPWWEILCDLTELRRRSSDCAKAAAWMIRHLPKVAMRSVALTQAPAELANWIAANIESRAATLPVADRDSDPHVLEWLVHRIQHLAVQCAPRDAIVQIIQSRGVWQNSIVELGLVGA